MTSSDNQDNQPTEASAWWPLKWMYLLAAVAIAFGADRSRDRENWGLIFLPVFLAPAVVLVIRDIVLLARRNSVGIKRMLRVASLSLGVLAIAVAIRYCSSP